MRILVPLDFNAPSRHACDWALHHARRMGQGEIYYLHVLETEPSDDDDLDRLKELEDEVDRMKVLAEEQLARALGSVHLPPNVQVRYVVARGKPDQEIIHKASELGAELIVIGTHGRTGFDRLYLGSVTEKVVRTAPCTVVVVKARPGDVAHDGRAPGEGSP